jgi:ABC-type sulfate/molybdate transport systems ATPase subunit
MGFEFKETLLYVEDFSVKYDDVTIVKDINIVEKNVTKPDHDCGQIIAIVGRSGRGKSTILRGLTGLVRPSSGKILIRDFSRPEADAAKSVKEGDIGFVDQKYTLFRHKTVLQALRFAARKSALSPAEREQKINEYLAEWGLEKVKDKYPNELSGGQRQRTAIIEQLLSSDKFIVLDEPFSGLDVGNIADVKKSFALLHDASDYNTVIFTTHDLELAIELAQSVYVIGYPTIDGVVQSYGTIVSKYDLREMGLAWQEYGVEHAKLHRQIVEDMMNS